MGANHSFQAAQVQLTEFIRNPIERNVNSDWNLLRANTYADLFYNNVEDFLSSFFPVLKEITPETRWHQMVREFFRLHQNKTPYFLEIGQEFLDFLENERSNEQDPPFLLELAHYEWVELALDISEDVFPTVGFNSAGDLLAGAIYLSPLICSLAYQFPVHKISGEFQPENAPEQPTFLIVFRNQNDDIRFMEINAVTARLLELIEQNPLESGINLLKAIAIEMNHPNHDLVIEGGLASLQHLKQQGVILGTRLTLIE